MGNRTVRVGEEGTRDGYLSHLQSQACCRGHKYHKSPRQDKKVRQLPDDPRPYWPPSEIKPSYWSPETNSGGNESDTDLS